MEPAVANCQRVGAQINAGRGGGGTGTSIIYYVLVLMAPADTLRVAQMASDVILALRGR